jgi:hypothetical protein
MPTSGAKYPGSREARVTAMKKSTVPTVTRTGVNQVQPKITPERLTDVSITAAKDAALMSRWLEFRLGV